MAVTTSPGGIVRCTDLVTGHLAQQRFDGLKVG